jgi:hypothetical protein
MGDRARLGSLGRRLFGALLLTALSAIVVMVAGMAITEQRVQEQLAPASRLELARALAVSAAADYVRDGGWDDPVVDVPAAGGDPADVHVVIRDPSGRIVLGGPVGPNFDRRAASAAVVVDGQAVGTVLVEARPESGAEAVERLSKRWLLASTVVASLVAAGVAYILAKRITARSTGTSTPPVGSRRVTTRPAPGTWARRSSRTSPRL